MLHNILYSGAYHTTCGASNLSYYRDVKTKQVRGERERLRLLKAAHAGVNAKAWDTSHASLDSELAKFQKFLKSKARRVAEEEVLQVKCVGLWCGYAVYGM